MKHILHPIIGDTKYGEGRHNRMFRESLDCHRMLLMARSIEFNHPISKQRLTIESPLSQEVVALYQKFNWLA
jgi:tRNA pseudouridine65 synthase